uniref:Transmembrane protein 18 n=1 Tax=Craspedostauros australis TaxID=1486917 RepID=A0A7R9ZM62_9STRA|mmetsp:Transcript_17790/g.49338  ORF Transcript_17790/g.49338 Transcript_17790/m.49338 type:complete len:275 (+) Transcript_17790:168-992(+)|eukprot:CAMPEP_0198117090 /NCGR_PEP_ID=MMETSP1442-20131203/16412_1 /TAXON_ID= /ORGANISM="Craspedostauros australis, Strain CCMP3328" /LENGTH=274 /DNA_ID=CAMNT_0043775061 /DNA_START=115 /DNA_END=939 /DNA_ORIENTATION=+
MTEARPDTDADAEGVFTKLANFVLETSEQVVNVVEDGLAAITTGEMEQRDGASSSHASSAYGGPGGDGGGEFEFSEDDDDVMMESPLNGIADGVLKDIMKGQTKPRSAMEHLNAFRAAISWSEPFILGVVVFQIVMFLLVLWMARPQRTAAARLSFLVFIAIIVRTAEYTNAWADRNWESFATQNYFDDKGFFMGTMVCGPLLVDSLIMLIMYVREAASLLVEVKTRELRRKKAQQGQQEQQQARDANATGKASKAKPSTKGSRKKKSKQNKQE